MEIDLMLLRSLGRRSSLAYVRTASFTLALTPVSDAVIVEIRVTRAMENIFLW
jgi:hypothetical protein